MSTQHHSARLKSVQANSVFHKMCGTVLSAYAIRILAKLKPCPGNPSSSIINPDCVGTLKIQEKPP